MQSFLAAKYAATTAEMRQDAKLRTASTSVPRHDKGGGTSLHCMGGISPPASPPRLAGIWFHALARPPAVYRVTGARSYKATPELNKGEFEAPKATVVISWLASSIWSLAHRQPLPLRRNLPWLFEPEPMLCQCKPSHKANRKADSLAGQHGHCSHLCCQSSWSPLHAYTSRGVPAGQAVWRARASHPES